MSVSSMEETDIIYMNKNSMFSNFPVDTHEIANRIATIIRSYRFEADDLSIIFIAMSMQDNMIGGKLWTTTDIENYISDEYADGELISVDEKQIAEVKSNLNEVIFSEATDREWNAIREAVGAAADKCNIHVTDIKWDVDKEEFDSEAEYEAVLANVLPTEVDIPLSELEGVCIADWLSDHNGYCVESYHVSTK